MVAIIPLIQCCLQTVQVRKAQIAIGDREVFVNREGERMSRLKNVDSDWIIRRMERWGRRVSKLIGCLHGCAVQ